MIWIPSDLSTETSAKIGKLFVQVSAEHLTAVVERLPRQEEILGRLGAGGPGIEPGEVERLYDLLEEVWDRAQGKLAERILRDPDLPSAPSRRAKVVARRLRKALREDPLMTALDDVLDFVAQVRDAGGGIEVVA